MAVSVRIDFAPPQDDDIVALRVHEAAAVGGPYSQIERTTAIGTPPNYISRYTTDLAASKTDWFAIQWEYGSGVLGPMSSGVQGGSQSLVAQVVSRVMLRDPTVNENIAIQESESAVSSYFSTADPYSVDPSEASPTVKSGLTLLALALSQLYIVATSTGSVQKFTAGLVAMDKGSSSTSQRKVADIEALIKLANKMLGLNYSVIAQLEEIEVAGGYTQLVAVDLTRAIIEVQ